MSNEELSSLLKPEIRQGLITKLEKPDICRLEFVAIIGMTLKHHKKMEMETYDYLHR